MRSDETGKSVVDPKEARARNAPQCEQVSSVRETKAQCGQMKVEVDSIKDPGRCCRWLPLGMARKSLILSVGFATILKLPHCWIHAQNVVRGQAIF